jgi:antitoxin component YwqK of YwqJK toxin-antitoxin module/peroxiredoxin
MLATGSLLPSGRAALLALSFTLCGCQLAENLVENMFRDKERTGRLIDGKQEGEWVFRYPSGALKAKGNYKNDKQIGHWTYWYENGNVEWEGEFDEERLCGPSRFGHENGKRRAVGSFVAGLEEDLWTFWTPDGTLDCEGDFVLGKPALRWTYFDAAGAPMAEGYRMDGERVGPWRFYGPGDAIAERRFPMPDGGAIVHETWDGDVPRREGFLVNGVHEGRWVTWHPNGRRRTTGDFVAGEPSGLWIAWNSAGEPVGRGHMAKGHPEGDWLLWRKGAVERVPAHQLDLSSSFSGEWSSADLSSGGETESVLANWVAEAASPATDTLELAPDPNIPPPSPEAVARTEATPSIALRPQPWTVREGDALEYLVARYSDGARDVQAPRRSGYGRRSRGAQEKEAGDPVLSPRFLGTQLPWTRFFRADKGVVDMDDFRGKKKVVLVVLRGFSREVCVYCITQTEALCDNVDAFRDEGCEVFVVYPGERNRLDVFMESFQAVSKHMGEPPIGVLYDRDMELVKRMGITSEFAIPSTFVIDERGVIRYSYVGRDIEDRPAASEVLDAIRAMSGP